MSLTPAEIDTTIYPGTNFDDELWIDINTYPVTDIKFKAQYRSSDLKTLLLDLSSEAGNITFNELTGELHFLAAPAITDTIPIQVGKWQCNIYHPDNTIVVAFVGKVYVKEKIVRA